MARVMRSELGKKKDEEEKKQFRKKLRRIRESIIKFQTIEELSKEEFALLQNAVDNIYTIIRNRIIL